MEARSNAGEEAFPIPAPAVTQRRKELRYRFAELLTEGKFDQALEEATRALEGEEILPRDFDFVQQIARAAKEKMARVRMGTDHSRC